MVRHIYTADPSAHVFNGTIYIYPSHDVEANVPEDDEGAHFNMRDYHVLSMNKIGGPVTDHGVALDLTDVPWAGRQLWAPDAAYKNGTYYLYFPAKDKQDVFRIGVATGNAPTGPFTYQGVIMNPVTGWTTHHSIIEFNGNWYLFYHDVELSGKTHLRNVKVRELTRRPNGAIETITP